MSLGVVSFGNENILGICNDRTRNGGHFLVSLITMRRGKTYKAVRLPFGHVMNS
jgi:hypothetical protein